MLRDRSKIEAGLLPQGRKSFEKARLIYYIGSKEIKMKKIRWDILMFALLLAVPAAIADELDTPHIVVYGTATIQVTPDLMIWTLNVRNLDPSSTGVAKAHETTVATAIALLKQNQIAEGKIQTSRMQLGENWNYVRNERVQDGYFASADIQFTLADFTKYTSIWAGLSGIKGVQVNNVSFDHSERIRFQNEARTKAVLAARDKAKAIAETLGLQIGQPLVVEEDLAAVEGYRALMPSSSNIVSNNISEVRVAGSSIDGNQSVTPGSIAIRSRVKATFGLPKK
jgi:uncharacterized protein